MEVPGINVPLLIQLPVIEWVKVPPSKVVEAPIFTEPVTVILEAAANDTEVPRPTLLVSEPDIVKMVEGIVLMAAPEELLKTRLP